MLPIPVLLLMLQKGSSELLDDSRILGCLMGKAAA